MSYFFVTLPYKGLWSMVLKNSINKTEMSFRPTLHSWDQRLIEQIKIDINCTKICPRGFQIHLREFFKWGTNCNSKITFQRYMTKKCLKNQKRKIENLLHTTHHTHNLKSQVVLKILHSYIFHESAPFKLFEKFYVHFTTAISQLEYLSTYYYMYIIRVH